MTIKTHDAGLTVLAVDHMGDLSGDITSFRKTVTTMQIYKIRGVIARILILLHSFVQPENRVRSPHGFALVIDKESFTKFGVFRTFPLLGRFPHNDTDVFH